MRTDISVSRPGWIHRLDYKKIILVVFLLRLITASAYDIVVTITNKDLLLPDSRFYSLRGRYVNLILEGYGDKGASFTKDLLPGDKIGDEIFIDALRREGGRLPPLTNESNIHSRIIGILYSVFGYFTIWVRIFNICISMLSVYLFFKIAKCLFGDLTANLFLLVALVLPVQFIYSVTLTRDFLRVFAISLVIWAAYKMGEIWTKRLRPQY